MSARNSVVLETATHWFAFFQRCFAAPPPAPLETAFPLVARQQGLAQARDPLLTFVSPDFGGARGRLAHDMLNFSGCAELPHA
jgi:hypothetical protein|eukprot:CAMPEP_0174309024 /NCGR_PEP_ID=MMETSP0810-20121108/2132_1 /TAXON_ID=73025 ORGANISM="Eutreptiella gymnastica-like, Strain CCMP1594" /NCGR_SAMPLE_ID=MMETSP0810 /ASSEMBLY_ACC=CAM_ASM_000659 /LENGTH=82 /DNA_ID=CAMNT_0015416515 /DNA_START=148 /DNA_END=396 /DNA_ORIENTATION=-